MTPAPPANPRREFLAGARNALPLALSGFPFGLLYGTLVTSSHLPAAVGQAMSSIIYAGSAQLIAVPLLAAGAPALVVIGIVFVVNLRHALYSATLAPYMRSLGRARRFWMAYFLTDEAFALSIARYQQSQTNLPGAHAYYAGAGMAWWLNWQVATAVGIFIGAQVPASWPLDFAVPLTFIALVVPMLKDRPGLVAAVVAGAVAVGAASLPYKLGLLLAVLAGIAAGMIGEARWKAR